MLNRNKKLPNIIWLVPDGIRTVPYEDKFGKLAIFQTLQSQGFIEYTNTYTAAPSTFMSFISFFSGIYSTYMTDTYGDLKANKLALPLIQNLLKKQGYNNYFFTWYEALKDMIDGFNFGGVNNQEKYDEYFYNCADGNCADRYVNYFLDTEKMEEPFCFFYHMIYTTKGIEKITNENSNSMFENVYNKISDKVDMNNTIFIIHSDHGYIIPNKNNYKEFIKHDLSMEQVNIKVPLYIKYPGSRGEKNHNNNSLIDIYPTLLELLNIPIPHNLLSGVSLLHRRKNNRNIRIDNRFITQDNRKTALIRENKKIVFHDEENIFKEYEIKSSEVIETEVGESIIMENYYTEEENRRLKVKKTIRTLNRKIKLELIEKEFQKQFHWGYIFLHKNEYLIDFVKKYLKDSTEISVIRNTSFERIILFTESLLLINIDKDINVFDKISSKIFKEIYIVDSYWNFEKIYNIDSFIKIKKRIFNFRNKRDLRNKNKVTKTLDERALLKSLDK